MAQWLDEDDLVLDEGGPDPGSNRNCGVEVKVA